MITISIDTTQATPEEIIDFKNKMKDSAFYLNRLFVVENIKTYIYSEFDEKIANDNGFTISSGLEPSVIYGNLERSEIKRLKHV